MGRVLASAGFIGVLSPWGFAVAVGTLGPAALNANLIFLSPTIAFQTLAVIPFVLVGSVLILIRLAVGPERATARTSGARAGPVVAIALGVVLVVLSLTQNVTLLTTIRGDWWKVDASTAATLRGALPSIPGDAEVIASQGVIGRFAERRYVYPFLAAPQSFPVRSGTVVFVIAPSQGIESVPAPAAQQAIDGLVDRPGVTVLARSGGATVLEWKPPPATTEVTLPG